MKVKGNWQKVVFVAFLSAFGVYTANVGYSAEYRIDFESYLPGTNTYHQGTIPADVVGTQYSYTHTLTEQGAPTVTLNSDWSDWGTLFGRAEDWSWSRGFTVSNVNTEVLGDARTTGSGADRVAVDSYVYSSNTFAAVAGVTNFPDDGYTVNISGADGSSAYAVLLGSSDPYEIGGTIRFSDTVSVKSLDFTNPAGALAVAAYGNTFCMPATDGNWASVILRGWNADGNLVGQKVLMLYDYTGNGATDGYTVTDWTTESLENLQLNLYGEEYYYDFASASQQIQAATEAGDFSDLVDEMYVADFGSFEDVLSLTFNFNGSDRGEWLNFPTYVALDNLLYSYGSEVGPGTNPDPENPVLPGSSVPEPTAWLLMILALPFGWWIRKR